MSEENATKNCPYCGESISVIAKKCKHCGEIIDETMRELENLKRQTNSNGPIVINNNNNNNNNGEIDDNNYHPNGLMALLYISRQYAYEVLGYVDGQATNILDSVKER